MRPRHLRARSLEAFSPEALMVNSVLPIGIHMAVESARIGVMLFLNKIGRDVVSLIAFAKGHYGFLFSYESVGSKVPGMQ